ncbi:hypothetical protein AB6F61_06930 [Providencia hangzhouensis]
MQAINSPNRHFIKQINIDSNAAHNIIDLETKGLLIIEQGSVFETPANSQSLNEGDIYITNRELTHYSSLKQQVANYFGYPWMITFCVVSSLIMALS